MTRHKKKKSFHPSAIKSTIAPVAFPVLQLSGPALPGRVAEEPSSSDVVDFLHPPEVSTSFASVGVSLCLTVSDVCLMLNISRSHFIRCEKAGLIPGRLLIGGAVRYHRDTLERWLLDSSKKLP